MRYLHDVDPPVLEMTRRNLMALLAKLDDPSSARTLMSPGKPGEPVIVVTSVEDAVHYADRHAGEVFMPSAGITWEQPSVAGQRLRLTGLLEDLQAQRYQPDTVADLVTELREVLGVPADTWVPLEGIDDPDTSTDTATDAATGSVIDAGSDTDDGRST